ncbi:MAG: hypothetical protein HY447_02540 [Candidatus Omnitrophica bacterium]|nr:hypothetical protein [Candidatus Omnitrophota bacterium]
MIRISTGIAIIARSSIERILALTTQTLHGVGAFIPIFYAGDGTATGWTECAFAGSCGTTVRIGWGTTDCAWDDRTRSTIAIGTLIGACTTVTIITGIIVCGVLTKTILTDCINTNVPIIRAIACSRARRRGIALASSSVTNGTLTTDQARFITRFSQIDKTVSAGIQALRGVACLWSNAHTCADCIDTEITIAVLQTLASHQGAGPAICSSATLVVWHRWIDTNSNLTLDAGCAEIAVFKTIACLIA